MYEFDQIQGFEAPKTVDCPRCDDEKSARRIPSVTATPRGSFGTAPRQGNDKVSEFNFDESEQGEFDLEDGA